MNILNIEVTQRRIMGVDKRSIWILLSMVVWALVTFFIFVVFCITNNIIWFLVAFFCFICVIPLIIVNWIKSNKYRGKNAVFVGSVEFCAKGGKLWVGESRILNICYSRKEKCVYVNDTTEHRTEVKGIPIKSSQSTFIGKIESVYVDDFLKFLESNGIECKMK